MLNWTKNWGLAAPSLAALLLVSGCGAPPPESAAQPPQAYEPPPPPPLAGGEPPMATDNSGLLGGPGAAPPTAPDAAGLDTYRRPDGKLVTAMAPIANPSAPSRAHVRPGHPRLHARSQPAPAAPVAAARPAKPAVVAKPPVAAKPSATAKPAVAPKPPVAAKPPAVASAPKPAPAKPATIKPEAAKPEAVKPVAPPAPEAKAPVSPASPAKADPKVAALQAALAPVVSAGSRLDASEALKTGPGAVTLALPATLAETLKAEAGKLGLGKAARKAEVTATLSGPGYDVAPKGPQTKPLKSGEAPVFTWQVTPLPGERGPLTADVQAGLKGVKKAVTVSLASLQHMVEQVAPAAAPKTGFDFSRLDPRRAFKGLGDQGGDDVSVMGLKVPSTSVVAAALVLGVVLILALIARTVSENRRQAERRRRFRTMTTYGNRPLTRADVEQAGGVAAPAAAVAETTEYKAPPPPEPAPKPTIVEPVAVREPEPEPKPVIHLGGPSEQTEDAERRETQPA